jgi:hypothetical protein
MVMLYGASMAKNFLMVWKYREMNHSIPRVASAD